MSCYYDSMLASPSQGLFQKLQSRLWRTDWILVGIIVVAAALRLFAVLSTKYWLPDSPAAQLLGDEPGYANTARELLNGLGYTWPGRVPLYPVFLAVLFWCTGESYRWIRILQCVLSVVTVVLTYALGKRLFGRRAGNIAALLVAISFPLVHQPTVIMSEVLFTPMLLFTGIVSVSAFRSPEVRKFALLGFCIGVCDLIRPTLLAYPLFIACALVVLLPNLQTALRCAASCVFAVALTVSPWMIFTYRKFGAFVLLATSNAFLWQGSPEYFHLRHEGGYTYERIWSEILYGPKRDTPDPMSITGDRYWTRRALASIRSEPLTYVKFASQKAVTYWLGDPGADWGNRNVFSYTGLRTAGYSPADAVKLMIARAAPIVAIAAVVLLWPQRHLLFPVYLLLVFTTVFHAATHAEARLNEPFQPFLMVLIAGAADLIHRAGARGS